MNSDHMTTPLNQSILSNFSNNQIISDLIPDIIAEVNSDKKYVWLNKAGIEFYGEDAIGKEAAHFFAGEQKTYDNVSHIFDGSIDKTHVDSWQIRKDGEKRLLSWTCKPLKNSTGDITGALSSAHDITDRVVAAELINKSQFLLQHIIDLLPVRIFWKDLNLKYLGCNLAFAKDSGKKTPDELLGKDDFEMPWKDQAEAYRSDDFEVIKSETPKINYEEEQTTPTGEKIYLITNKVPYRNNSGEIIGVLGTYADITDSKRNEEKLKQALANTEKMNEIMVNRELKMVELKKEIDDLRKTT